MENQTVSVLLPVYNMEDTIDEAMESVLSQKGTQFELIVVNDGSTDNTGGKLENFKHLHNVRIIYQPNQGKVSAFNRAHKEAKGGFVVLFAGDDIMPDDSLCLRKELILSTQDPLAVCCGKLLSFSKEKKFDNILIPKTRIPHFSGGVIMFTKNLSEIIFPIPEELPNEDNWTTLVIKKFSSQIIVSDKIFLRYRIHEKNTIKMDSPFNVFSREIHKRMEANKIFLEKFKDFLNNDERREILQKIELEEMRFSGNTPALFIKGNVHYKEKIKNIVYSNKNLYYLKVLFFRYLTGWNS